MPVTSSTTKGGGYNIFPKLPSTHTCRDFDAIAEWAKGRQIKDWLVGEEAMEEDELKWAHPELPTVRNPVADAKGTQAKERI